MLAVTCCACTSSTHHQLTAALNNSEEQVLHSGETLENGERLDLYCDLIVKAVNGQKDREAALLWHAATHGHADRESYILEKKIVKSGATTYNKLIHMLRHHADLWTEESFQEIW
tara:strand:- start:152 stop:496 length:345 start_codon:yes stop_codon:yes gene_type:complete